MTLEDYLRNNNGKSIDHSIRAHVNGDTVEFYIHPQGVDGDTADFIVKGNELKCKAQPKFVDGIARRARMDLWTEAEKAIHVAIQEVEKIGADVRLTKAVTSLGDAANFVADYLEDENIAR